MAAQEGKEVGWTGKLPAGPVPVAAQEGDMRVEAGGTGGCCRTCTCGCCTGDRSGGGWTVMLTA